MKRRRLVASMVMIPLAGGLSSLRAAEAVQTYPSRPIRFVNPFAAGGPFDNIVRLIADKLSSGWGQPVIVENKPGAAGMLGTALVAKAPGDGYTILFGASGIAQNPSLYPKMPYEPGELMPVAQLHSIPLGLAVNASLGVSTLREFIDRAMAERGKLTYGSISTSAQVLGEMLKQAAGIDIVRVPYRGEAPALSDLLGGQISASFLSPGTPARHGGKLRLLAVSGDRRIPGVDAPTFPELGFPTLSVAGWGGVFVPSTTPAVIVEKLSGEIMRIGVMPDVVERTITAGFPITVTDHHAFTKFVRTETEFWARVVKEFQVSVE